MPDAKKAGGKKRVAAGAGGTVKPSRRGNQPSLREALTSILKNSRKPLSARELAEQILATGYHSDSKTFVNVVWTMLGKMKNIERVPEKGFRLRRN
ncbi:MAG TPA: hypothetical protein VMG10_02690 [Gemmataceae bacterium]|nr:hypothetical protein [Gemmataceae bacterium]